MNRPRRCSRSACAAAAVATLTYVYADSTAVLGPLAGKAEPHTYDLCARHATSMTAPRGWQVVRLGATEFSVPDELVAVADAVREGEPADAAPSQADESQPGPFDLASAERGRRGHLRVLAEPDRG